MATYRASGLRYKHNYPRYVVAIVVIDNMFQTLVNLLRMAASEGQHHKALKLLSLMVFSLAQLRLEMRCCLNIPKPLPDY